MRFRFRSAPPVRDRQQIERDLAQLGVAEDLRGAMCQRLEAITPPLGEDAYQAALLGIAAANEVRGRGERELARSLGDLREVQRLLGLFSDEMKKLDAALRVLSNYVQRMRPKSSAPERPRSVH